MTQTELPACGRCGSTALHHAVHGMPSHELFEEGQRRPDLRLAGCCVEVGDWSTECLTCGQRRLVGASDASVWTTATRPETAGLVTGYAALARGALDMATTSAVSYAGLWLLLARLAPIASDTHRTRLVEVLGVSCDDAAALAAELLAAPHPTVATALGAWSRVPIKAGLPVVPHELPDQAGLDRWAAEHTRGLIEQFPLEIDPETLLVLATALVLQPFSLPLDHRTRHGRLRALRSGKSDVHRMFHFTRLADRRAQRAHYRLPRPRRRTADPR